MKPEIKRKRWLRMLPASAKDVLVRNLNRFRETSECRDLERSIQASNKGDSAKGTVLFMAPTELGFSRGGKVTAAEYLPEFCSGLRTAGFNTRFVSRVRRLRRSIQSAQPPVIVVLVYQEVGHTPEDAELDAVLEMADLVFNHPSSGKIIASKSATNRALVGRGVPMPTLASRADIPVFSNADCSSGHPVEIVPPAGTLDPTRYNTSFIDTSRAFGTTEYFTTVRLMCVDDKITHCYVFARDVSEASPSVHARNTPVDPDVMNALYAELVPPYAEQYKSIALKIAEILGPGFYSHDVLVDVVSGKALVCEVGYKFDNPGYCRRMSPVSEKLSGMSGFANAREIAKNSVQSFVSAIESRVD